jgi:hypothetical protein
MMDITEQLADSNLKQARLIIKATKKKREQRKHAKDKNAHR